MSEERVENAFSPEGNLYQVEYALEGMKKGVPCVVVGKNGIAMAAAKRIPEKLMDSNYITSFFEIFTGTVAIITGYPMDIQAAAMEIRKLAVTIVQDLKKAAPPADILARQLADKYQILTQKNSRRLPAIAVSIVGFDTHRPLLYYTDTSGILLPYKGVAFGEGETGMMKKLAKIYRPDGSDNEILETALEALEEALGSQYLATNIEVAILYENKPLEKLDTDQIDTLLVKIAEKE